MYVENCLLFLSDYSFRYRYLLGHDVDYFIVFHCFYYFYFHHGWLVLWNSFLVIEEPLSSQKAGKSYLLCWILEFVVLYLRVTDVVTY